MVNEETVISSISHYQPNVWSQLTKISQSGLIGNGYIFSGPTGCGKEGLALLFSQYLNCENPKEDVCGSCPSCFRFQGLQNEKLKLVVPLPAPKSKSSNGEENSSISKGDLEFYMRAEKQYLTEIVKGKEKIFPADRSKGKFPSMFL